MNYRLLTVVCWLLALAIGCERRADVSQPKQFQDRGVSFAYPGNWQVTKDKMLPSGRLLFLEAPGAAVVLLTIYNPGLDVAIEEYAQEFRQGLGAAVPFNLLQHSSTATNDGGIDCKYSLSLAGTDLPHTANITQHVFGETKVVCLSQVADEDRHLVEAGFDLVRRTLKVTSEKPDTKPTPTSVTSPAAQESRQ